MTAHVTDAMGVSMSGAVKTIMRPDVIVTDQIGRSPVIIETAEALDRVVDAGLRETHPIALSSNLHPAGFDELMSKTFANATVDQLSGEDP
jgi:hypothetical protein